MNTYYKGTTPNTCMVNTMLNLDNAIADHFSKMLFKGDMDRLTYASTRRCFRERAKTNKGSLNLPFMNIYRTNVTAQKLYPSWRNKGLTINGRFIPELGCKVRAMPVTVAYDANVFYGSMMADTFIANGLTLQDDAYETRLKYTLPVQDTEYTLDNIAVLSYNPAFDNLYSDDDYFEKNVIRNIQLDFSFDTFLFLDVNKAVGLTEEAVLNLATTRGIDLKGISPEEAYSIILDEEGVPITTQTLGV